MNQILKLSGRYFWLIGLIPIYLYFKTIFIFSQNIPHWDDYAIIAFVNKFNNSNDFFEKINLIFAQHNEHRIAFTRLIALLIFKINGSLNFQWMICFGNLALVGILVVFYKFLKKNNFSANYLVPVCFIIFQLALYENSFWGMASVQNFWVVFFVLMAFWQIANEKLPYFWGFLAAFTSANGVLFVPLIGLIGFLYFKNYKKLLLFSLFCIFIIFSYFIFYEKPPNSQPVVIDFFNNIKAGLITLGSVFDINLNFLFEKRELISILFGTLILFVSFVFLLINYLEFRELNQKVKFNFLFLAAILLFVAGTCFLTSITRLQYGFYVFLTSKYKIYSIIAFCTVYLMAIVHFKYFGKQLVLVMFTLAAIFINFSNNYNSIAEIKNYKKSEIASFFNGWHNGKSTVGQDSNSCFKYQNTIFDNVINENSTDERHTLGNVILTKTVVQIINNEYLVKGTKPENGAYLEFASAKNRYLFSTNQVRLNGKKTYLLNRKPFYGVGFTAEIPLMEIPADNYFINILDKTNEGINRINTNYYIEIEGLMLKKKPQNWE